MSTSIGDIAAQLADAINRIDRAAVLALRAQADADQAAALYSEAATGTNHPKIRQAVTDAKEGSDKAAKVGRLLAEAANAFTDYLNTIAPGIAPARQSSPGSGLTGEQLVTDAEKRSGRFEAAFRKQLRKADDAEDAIKKTEDAGRAAYKHFKHHPPDPGSASAGSATPPQPSQPDRPELDNPITAIVMATGVMVVAGKAAWNHAKKQHERSEEHDGDAK